jgi:hypothetical protein
MADNIADNMRQFAVPIDDLVPKERNPNQGDVGQISVLFERVGQRWPILYRTKKIDGKRAKQKVIEIGNHRWYAAQGLGWDEIAAVDLDDMSEAEAEAFGLGDNRVRDLAQSDRDVLAEVLAALADQDADLLLLTGFDADDLDLMLHDQDVDWDKLGAEFPDDDDAEEGLWRKFTISLPSGLYEQWTGWFDTLDGNSAPEKAKGWIESL